MYSDLRTEHSEVQLRAKEWQDKFKDLENVHYHSGPNSTGEGAKPIAANGSHSDLRVLQPPILADRVEPPTQSFWPRPQRLAARESLPTGQSLLTSVGTH